jgi:hypothetical protein
MNHLFAFVQEVNHWLNAVQQSLGTGAIRRAALDLASTERIFNMILETLGASNSLKPSSSTGQQPIAVVEDNSSRRGSVESLPCAMSDTTAGVPVSVSQGISDARAVYLGGIETPSSHDAQSTNQ